MHFLAKYLWLTFIFIGLISCSESKVSSTSVDELKRSVFDITSEMSNKERNKFIENISIISNSISKNIAGIPDINTLNYFNNKSITQIDLEAQNIISQEDEILSTSLDEINQFKGKFTELKNRKIDFQDKFISTTKLRLKIKSIEGKIKYLNLEKKSSKDNFESLYIKYIGIQKKYKEKLSEFKINETEKKTKKYQNIKNLYEAFETLGFFYNSKEYSYDYKYEKSKNVKKIIPTSLEYFTKPNMDNKDYLGLFISFDLFNHTNIPIKMISTHASSFVVEFDFFKNNCEKFKNIIIKEHSKIKVTCEYKYTTTKDRIKSTIKSKDSDKIIVNLRQEDSSLEHFTKILNVEDVEKNYYKDSEKYKSLGKAYFDRKALAKVVHDTYRRLNSITPSELGMLKNNQIKFETNVNNEKIQSESLIAKLANDGVLLTDELSKLNHELAIDVEMLDTFKYPELKDELNIMEINLLKLENHYKLLLGKYKALKIPILGM